MKSIFVTCRYISCEMYLHVLFLQERHGRWYTFVDKTEKSSQGENMELFEFYNKIEEYQNQKNNILATVLEGENSGSRYFFSKGDLITVYGDGAIPDEQLKEIAQAQQSRITEADGQKVFVEALKQPAHLVICGAGHVSQQVILLAAKVGFHVTVLEDRPSFAGEARRMGADRVICDSFEHGLDQIPDREDTYFLVVTRGHRYDKECLDIILKKPHCYVGMMASRGRAALLKKQMEEEGIDWKLLDKIHTPVGMPINAETPEEIAISIVSELIHEKNSLRKTSGYKKDLMEYLTGRKKAENGMALATIIERRGSAPREIGTKMLVLADGTLIGTIGGGCMESEVQHQCLRLIHDGDRKGRIFKVDMTVSEAEEEGLVCGGTIQVFLEVL